MGRRNFDFNFRSVDHEGRNTSLPSIQKLESIQNKNSLKQKISRQRKLTSKNNLKKNVTMSHSKNMNAVGSLVDRLFCPYQSLNTTVTSPPSSAVKPMRFGLKK